MYQINVPDEFIKDFNTQYPSPEIDKFIPSFLKTEQNAELYKTVKSQLELQGVIRVVFFSGRTAYDLVKKTKHEISGDPNNPPQITPIPEDELESVINLLEETHTGLREVLAAFDILNEENIEVKVEKPSKPGVLSVVKTETKTVSRLSQIEAEAHAVLMDYHRIRRSVIVWAWINYCKHVATQVSRFAFEVPEGKKY